MSEKPPNMEEHDECVSQEIEVERYIAKALTEIREHVDDKFSLLTREIHMSSDNLRDEVNLKLDSIRHEASTVGVALGRLQSHEGRMIKAEMKLKAIGWSTLFILFMGALLTILVGSHQGWLPVVPELQRHQLFEQPTKPTVEKLMKE